MSKHTPGPWTRALHIIEAILGVAAFVSLGLYCGIDMLARSAIARLRGRS